MRILHLSDLHAKAAPAADQQRIVQAALDDIGELDSRVRVDYVVFSGDLAFDGSADAFNSARELLLDPLTHLLPGRPVILTPGNHDVDRTAIKKLIELGLRQQIVDVESAAEVVAGDELEDAVARLGEWTTFHSSWYAGDPSVAAVEPLACLHSFNHESGSVGFASLNTSWRCSDDFDRGRLVISEPQLERAFVRLAEYDVRFVVMHHPLEWLADFDADAVRRRFENLGVFVLTGHDHVSNPTAEITPRGAALYSRAGCLYAGRDYANRLTVLDLDRGATRISVQIRRWLPNHQSGARFGIDADIGKDGTLSLPWPDQSQIRPIHQVSVPKVIEPLALIAQEQSVLDQSKNEASVSRVDDFVMPPRLWPVPEGQTAPRDREFERRIGRPDPIDPIAALREHRVVLISGDKTSGVTSSLLYILEQHFEQVGTHVPAYVLTDGRFSLGRINQNLALARSHIGDEETPVIIALDDVALADRDARARFVRFISENPDLLVVVGCHGQEHVVLAELLAGQDVSHTRAFLGALGRRELRQLATRLVGTGSRQIVDRVLEMLHRNRLPRNPLNIAALVAVVIKETEDIGDLNESGLLQSYVTLLLDSAFGPDTEGLGLDFRRREVLLTKLAQMFVRTNRSRVLWPDAELFVLEYLREIGQTNAPASRYLDALVARRVLISGEDGVGFRYQALLFLFAGNVMNDDAEFAAEMLADPIRNADVIRHAAGLKRTDADLLRKVSEAIRGVILANAEGVTAEQFNLLRDETGWSAVEGLQDARALIAPPPPPPTEEELDTFYDEVAEDIPEGTPAVVFRDEELEPTDRLGQALELLAAVLKGSELVENLELKADVLRQVISGWSRITVLVAIREDERGTLREILAALIDDDEDLSDGDRAELQSLIDHFTRLFILFMSTYALRSAVGNRYLQGALEKVTSDQDFMSETAHAFFAYLLYELLDLPDWPSKLSLLLEQFGTHEFVREIVRRQVLTKYHRDELSPAQNSQVENLLADIVAITSKARTAEAKKRERGEIITQLRRDKTLAKWHRSAEKDDDA